MHVKSFGYALASVLFLQSGTTWSADLAGVDVHGSFDAQALNAYVSPRGALVYDEGVNAQFLTTLTGTFYKAPDKFINSMTVVAVGFNDLQSTLHDPEVGVWREFDYYTGVSVGFAKNWVADLGWEQFVSPGSVFRAVDIVTGTLTYKGIDIAPRTTLNPYLTGFYSPSGGSAVGVGQAGKTGYVEVGAKPAIDLTSFPIPNTIVMPTYVQIAPRSFYGGGRTGVGLFSTTLQSVIPIPSLSRGGISVHMDIGVTYDHFFNERLVYLEQVVGQTSAGRNPVIGNIGFGFTF